MNSKGKEDIPYKTYGGNLAEIGMINLEMRMI